MKKLIISLVLVSFMFACSQGVVDDEKSSAAPEKTAPVADAKVANPHDTGEIPLDKNGQPAEPVKKERKFSIPKEVSEKYKSLILEVKNVTENSTVETEVLIGQKSEVTGTPFEVLVEYYLPDFVIDADGTITTRSAEEKNPVVKIKVFKFGEVYFDGWLYKNHPSEHGNFEDKVYSITLVKSITK